MGEAEWLIVSSFTLSEGLHAKLPFTLTLAAGTLKLQEHQHGDGQVLAFEVHTPHGCQALYSL